MHGQSEQIAGTFSGAMSHKDIPDFFVYGEPSRSLDIGFVHVETVRARNSAHFGHVAPHRHPQMAQITLWISGSGNYQIEDKTWIFSAPAVSFVPSTIIHGFTIEPDADAIVVSMADSLLNGVAAQTSMPLDSPIFFAGQPQDPTWQRLGAILNAIAAEYADAHPNDQTVMSGLIGVALSLLARLSANAPADLASPRVALAIRFRRAVDVHYRQDWTIERYVDLLGSTQHLLSKASAQVLGAAPKDVVLERRLLEAKRLLLFTIRPVEDIAFEIGFKDPSYFSRFFRRRCGTAPKHWRSLHSG